MKQTRTLFIKLFLLVALLTGAKAYATDFIEEVRLVGGNKSTVTSWTEYYNSLGYTRIENDLNKGCGSSSDYIYLFYKTATSSDGENRGYITGFYLKYGADNVNDELIFQGRTYRLVTYKGGADFVSLKGDLNSNAQNGSASIHLYYTTDIFPNKQAVTGITFNNDSEGALGEDGGSTAADLNKGAGGDYIYMHLTTATAQTNHSPKYAYDACEVQGFNINVRGWAFDPDASSASINVRINVFTDSGCDTLYKSVTATANKTRDDVNQAFHITGQHGFNEIIEFDDPGTYYVCVTAIDGNGDGNVVMGPKTANVSFTKINSSNTPTTWGAENTATTYKVTGDATFESRITVNGDVTLFLGEGTTLTAEKSIIVNDGNKLTIDGTGSLVATGSTTYPGIGAYYNHGYGEIVINNGHITATSEMGAAIGGNGQRGGGNTNGKITINGGVIYTVSTKGGAAIGGGYSRMNGIYYSNPDDSYYTLADEEALPGTVVINGGQVTAIADPTVYAIGRGTYSTGNSGSITLGWTNPTDFIYATRLDTELLSIAEGKTFVIEGTGIEVNNDNKAILANLSNGTLWSNNVNTLSAATVSGILPAYTYRAEPFLPTYTVTDVFGTVLTEGTDFTAALTSGGETVAQLNAVGSYTLTLTGTGQYIGTRTFDIEVQDIVAPPRIPGRLEDEYTAIQQTAHTATTATLEWRDVNADVTTWKLEYSKNYHFDEAYAPVQELTVTGTPSVTITGLDPETSYYARVKAVYYGLESDWGGYWWYHGGHNNEDTTFYNGSTRFGTTAKTWAGSGKTVTSHEYIKDMYLPYYYMSWESLPCDQLITQQIYTADEIGRAGYINSLSFRTELPKGGYRLADYLINRHGLEWYEERLNLYPEHPLQVYLVQTDKVSFSDAEDMIPYTEADLVWSGQLTEAPDSWNTITFSTPFPYDGRHNLAVIIFSINSNHSSGDNVRGWCGFYNYFTDKPQALYYRTDVGVHGLVNDGYESSNTGNPFKNHMRFDISNSLVLADQTDHSSDISAADGQTMGVTLSDRTLYRDGDWNTLCLPFNMGDATAAEGHHFDGTELEGATVMQLNPATSNLTDGTLTLNFSDATNIEAGKPYIVKWDPDTYIPYVQEDCRLITSAADWDAFAAIVNARDTVLNAVLVADISVSTMVGIVGSTEANSHRFSGTFDGNGHTITFNYGTAESPYTEYYCGLFTSIDGATIKNLHVAGNIYTNSYYAGGLVGQATGNCTIANCHVSTNVTGLLDTYGVEFYHGGIIGSVGYNDKNADVSITDCLFDGQLNGPNTGIAGCKGFVGCLFINNNNYHNNTASVTITRSLFDPSGTLNHLLPDYAATFAIGGKFADTNEPGTATITDCYYTQVLGMPQGTDASSMSATDLAAALGSNWTVSGGKAVPALTPGYSYLECTAPTFGPYQIVGAAPAAVTFDEGRCSFQGTYEPFNDRTGLLLDKRNTTGNGVFQAGIDLKGYVVNGWFTDAARTIPATYIPFDENTGQVTLYLNTTEAVKRTVNAATNWDDPTLPIDGWNFVSSPVTGSIAPSAVTNLFPVVENVPNPLSTYYDLYRLNTGTTMWENYKAHDNDFTLDNGLGYLYASKDKTTLVFTAGNSSFNTGTSKTIDNLPKGFSLVGNPFKVNAYINKPYYILDETGTYVVPTVVEASNPIAPCTGVVVEVTDDDITNSTNSVTFSTTLPSQSTGNNGHLNITLAQKDTRRGTTGREDIIDQAIVSFNESSQLSKFNFGEQDANISIPMGKEEYAIAFSNGHGEIPVNFKAKQNGTYTLTVSATANCQLPTANCQLPTANCQLPTANYLHLIDNLTGDNIDLLQTPSYTFEGKTTDYASRFKLVFSAQHDTEENEVFAFFSDGHIIVNGTGTLQVIDMMGRVLVSKELPTANSQLPTANFTPGVYVLRLINGSSVKTQKIVISF